MHVDPDKERTKKKRDEVDDTRGWFWSVERRAYDEKWNGKRVTRGGKGSSHPSSTTHKNRKRVKKNSSSTKLLHVHGETDRETASK